MNKMNFLLIRPVVLALQVCLVALLVMAVLQVWQPIWVDPTVWQIQSAVDTTALLALIGAAIWVLPRSLLDRYYTGGQLGQKSPGEKQPSKETVSSMNSGGHRAHRTFGFAEGHMAALAGRFRAIVGGHAASHRQALNC